MAGMEDFTSRKAAPRTPIRACPSVQGYGGNRCGQGQTSGGLRFRSARKRDFDAATKRLIHDAVALGEPQQSVELLFRGRSVEFDVQPDRGKSHGSILGHTERAPEVEIPLGMERTPAKLDSQCCGHRTKRNPCARDERLEEHIPGAGQFAGPACGWMQSGFKQRTSRIHTAGNSLPQPSVRPQGDMRGCWITPVAILQRCLKCTKCLCVHRCRLKRGTASTQARPITLTGARTKLLALGSSQWLFEAQRLLPPKQERERSGAGCTIDAQYATGHS